ncbi:hypothetical protein LCGC14_3135910 [marine sediment metagenome]|uniref:Uncharacterized protein n=1 Tax=marine sediment metagenome TaxID=412755 RepID=A0A0F8Y5D7_9ZZZZ
MTNKEIEIQVALGALPLWKQIELNMVELKETEEGRSRFGPRVMRIKCEGIREYYAIDQLFTRSNRQSAIKLLILQAKKLKL